MDSMYDMLKSLPLFKGTSSDQISSFLERTPLTFANFSEGEIILEQDTQAEGPLFVVSGEVRIEFATRSLGLFSFNIPTGSQLAGFNLFGLHLRMPYRVVAASSKTSIMQFDKSHFVDLVKSDHIYFVNYLNDLALNIQRPAHTLINVPGLDLRDTLTVYINTLSPKNASRLTLEPGLEFLVEHRAEIEKIAAEGLITLDGEVIRIPNRRDFLI